MNQTFPKILIASILIVLVVGGIFAWQYFGKQERAIQTSEITKDEIADWQTYRNEEFGFEVKYPDGWTVVTKSPRYITITTIESVLESEILPEGNAWISFAVGVKGPYEGKQENTVNGKVLFSGSKVFSSNDGRLVWAGQEYWKGDLSAEQMLNQIVSTFQFLDKESTENVEKTDWKEYVLEKITDEYDSLDFMDRQLVGIRDDGQRDVIVASARTLMSWEKVPGEAGHYPVKVSFPSYSSKIYFVKYLAGTGHSAGLFEFDVNNFTYRELPNTGEIYENYLNYKSAVSPDGLRIASLGGDSLYMLHLSEDRAKILVEAQPGEVFFAAQEIPDFKWIDNVTIQYPVASSGDFTVIAVKRITVER